MEAINNKNDLPISYLTFFFGLGVIASYFLFETVCLVAANGLF